MSSLSARWRTNVSPIKTFKKTLFFFWFQYLIAIVLVKCDFFHDDRCFVSTGVFLFHLSKNQLLFSSCMIFRHVLMIDVLSSLSFKHLKILTSQLVRILSLHFKCIPREILNIDYKKVKKERPDASWSFAND